MKKNLNKLIAQVELIAANKLRGGFKITAKNATQYTNKILVDMNQYNKPSSTQLIIEEEMKDYRMAQVSQRRQRQDLQQGVKQKTTKPATLQHQIIKLEGCVNILMMEDVMAAIRVAKRDELLLVRPKLVKLQNHLSFKLQSQELEPHMEQPIEAFLKELNEVINKTNKYL